MIFSLPTLLLISAVVATDTVVADDLDTRVNPVLESSAAPRTVSPARYPFLNLAADTIAMNGADWSDLATMLQDAGRGDTTVSIVHIGDSHVQADANTARVRQHLQDEYGDAGRGLIAPLKIARTNQPLDYYITTTTPVTTATLLKMPWPVQMGFTGVAVKPNGNGDARFNIQVKKPFDVINIYADQPVHVLSVMSGKSRMAFTCNPKPWGAEVVMSRPMVNASIDIEGSNYILYGFDLRKAGAHGVLYHNIGNNGAAYGTYTMIDGMGQGVANLAPQLVIISLGANEAYGRITDEAFKTSMTALINEIRRYNPDAKILLTTPQESQRSVYTRRRGRKRKGRRRLVTSRTYRVNSNVARLRNDIIEYGREHNIPVFDFYQVAGGAGSSEKWVKSGLMSNDRIHRTWTGYYLEGDLLHRALTKSLKL